MGPSPGLRSYWLLLALALAGCSGTPFGDRLAGSFSGQQGQPPAGSPAASPAPSPATSTTQAPAAPAATPASPAPASPRKPASAATGSSAATATAGATAPVGPAATASRPAAGSQAGRGAAPAPPQPSRSAVPYRVTLRLPQADPSAPAEGLTEALRAAGVAFEVETIERLQAGGAPAAPVARPAPAPPLTPP